MTFTAIILVATLALEGVLTALAVSGRFGTWRWALLDATPLMDARNDDDLQRVRNGYHTLATWCFYGCAGMTAFVLVAAAISPPFGILTLLIAALPLALSGWSVARARALEAKAQRRLNATRPGLGGPA
jgi:hypothetical protein